MKIVEKMGGDLFQVDDVMEVLFQRDDWYVARHLIKETEHVFPASQFVYFFFLHFYYKLSAL